jgi:hypothetical protein
MTEVELARASIWLRYSRGSVCRKQTTGRVMTGVELRHAEGPRAASDLRHTEGPRVASDLRHTEGPRVASDLRHPEGPRVASDLFVRCKLR